MQSHSPAPEPQTKSDGKKSSEMSKTVQRQHQVGNVRTPRVIAGILPCVRTTKKNRDADSVKSALLRTGRLAVSLTKERKRLVVKVLLPVEEFHGIRLRISGH